MSKITIPYVEFYITNVCNLACSGCNRFNNFDFKGWQRWADYAQVYKRWSEDVTPQSLAILGGEPLLNPTLLDWVDGLHQLWPTSTIRIISNGFQLPRVKNFYSVLKNTPNVELWVGIHNKQHKQKIIDNIEQFLTQPVTYKFDNSNQYQEKLYITDAQGVKVTVEYNWWFHQGSIVVNELGQKTLHQSSAEKAHTNCHMKTCHHFVHGKLYKCGVVAVLPEFDQQHELALSAEDRELLYSYQPLSVDATFDTKQTFVDNLSQSIAQCRFCPEQYHGQMIFAEEKKNL